MDERKKLLLAVVGGLVALLLLTSRFFIPLNQDNAQRAEQFRKLKTEVGAIGEVGKHELESAEAELDKAISGLEEKLSTEGKTKLVEQLTRVPDGADIVFTDIAHREFIDRQGYQALPLELTLKTSFGDLMRYLVETESSPLMIGLDRLEIRKSEPGAKSLEIRAVFFGFRSTQESFPMSQYMEGEGKYAPYDAQRLTELLRPVIPAGALNAALELNEYNPFLYLYKEAPKITAPAPVEPETVTKIESLSLKGITRVGGKKVALINNTVVREGEQLGDVFVLEIQDSKVVLTQLGKKHVLKVGVGDEFIKPY